MGRIAQDSYHEADRHTLPRGWPDPVPRSADRITAWAERTRVALASDPGGCWVAERDSEVVGLAVSRVRDTLWLLSSFAVRADHRGRGVGRQLLDAALHHGRGCLRGMLASSSDPTAMRCYRRAGFDLHPQFVARGVVDRRALPRVGALRTGSLGDRDLLDSLDRRTRGAVHGIDHEVLAAQFQLLIADRPDGQGYAYVGSDGSAQLLAATSKRIAVDLLWESLAQAPDGAVTEQFHISAANQWALDVLLDARLDLASHGHLALRGMKPPAPYLHHGSLL